jgi:hypothetical protein
MPFHRNCSSRTPVRFLRQCTHILRAAEGDTGDARHPSKVQLLDGLASLLLVAGVNNRGGTSGDASLASLTLRLIAGGVLVLLLDGDLLGLLLLLLRDFLDARLSHVEELADHSLGQLPHGSHTSRTIAPAPPKVATNVCRFFICSRALFQRASMNCCLDSTYIDGKKCR